MKFPFVVALGVTLAFAAGSAFAANPPAKTLTPQQQKMKDCNAQAGAKKGDERKAFMKQCLSGPSAMAAKPMTQQEKMKACNADAGAKHLTGDARKAFMSTCLKGDGAAAH
jgi:hypothetical protein